MMHLNLIKLWTGFLLLLFLSSDVLSSSTVLNRKGMLLLFMNPNGRPCQIQEQYLQASQADIEKHVKIHLVKTTVQSDRMLFYKYGIRSLPTIVLLNSDGTVFKRLPPGIHRAETILNIVNQ